MPDRRDWDRCRSCGKDSETTDDRFSFGVYAMHACDPCWRASGYRDATDPDARLDPDDAGEQLEPED